MVCQIEDAQVIVKEFNYKAKGIRREKRVALEALYNEWWSNSQSITVSFHDEVEPINKELGYNHFGEVDGRTKRGKQYFIKAQPIWDKYETMRRELNSRVKAAKRKISTSYEAQIQVIKESLSMLA